MAKASEYAVSLGGADNATQETILQGTQRVWRGICKRNGLVVDITDWTITAKAEYYKATVSGRRNPTITGLTPISGKADLDLTVDKETSVTGGFTILLPTDIYTDPITPDGNDLPVVVVHITYRTDDTPPRVEKHRRSVVIRHAK